MTNKDTKDGIGKFDNTNNKERIKELTDDAYGFLADFQEKFYRLFPTTPNQYPYEIKPDDSEYQFEHQTFLNSRYNTRSRNLVAIHNHHREFRLSFTEPEALTDNRKKLPIQDVEVLKGKYPELLSYFSLELLDKPTIAMFISREQLQKYKESDYEDLIKFSYFINRDTEGHTQAYRVSRFPEGYPLSDNANYIQRSKVPFFDEFNIIEVTPITMADIELIGRISQIFSESLNVQPKEGNVVSSNVNVIE